MYQKSGQCINNVVQNTACYPGSIVEKEIQKQLCKVVV